MFRECLECISHIIIIMHGGKEGRILISHSGAQFISTLENMP